MTPQERRHPELIKGSRRLRIAKGSGTNVQAVKALIKQFEQMRKVMKAGCVRARCRTSGRLCVRHANLSRHMSVRLRLTRVGGRKNPIWRVVVADQRSKRDGRVIETVGHYNAQTEPSTIVLDEAKVKDWLARGAQPTDTVKKLLRTQGING